MAASTVSWWSSSPFLANKSVNPTKRSVPRSVSFPAKKCGEFRPLVRAIAGVEFSAVGEDGTSNSPPALGVTIKPKNLPEKEEIPWEIKEDWNDIKILLNVKPFAKEDVKVSVEDDALLVKGENKKERTGGHDHGWHNRDVKDLSFRLLLPINCEKDNIKAELGVDGVLFIRIPKTQVAIDVPIIEKY